MTEYLTLAMVHNRCSMSTLLREPDRIKSTVPKHRGSRPSVATSPERMLRRFVPEDRADVANMHDFWSMREFVPLHKMSFRSI
jgi:hypothetical protein